MPGTCTGRFHCQAPKSSLTHLADDGWPGYQRFPVSGSDLVISEEAWQEVHEHGVDWFLANWIIGATIFEPDVRPHRKRDDLAGRRFLRAANRGCGGGE